ncbi:MAG TPA: penicillin-binding transpeptidase domain-containing protein, partial [Beijerinckiaceae bacterium]
PPPQRVAPADKVAELNNMMKEVVNAGTARAAQLRGVQAAGKTGTTNGYKDAWFDGYTGNYVGTIWFGNDSSTSMRNMTGGSLPARTWREIMDYAHQGVELKNPYGVRDTPAPPPAVAKAEPSELGPAQRPATLSRRSSETLGSIERLMRSNFERMGPADVTGSISGRGSVARLGAPTTPAAAFGR